MAITAKCDVFPVPNATNVDVQPAVGEIWMVKAIITGSIGAGGGSGILRLFDGTDNAIVFRTHDSTNRPVHPGKRPSDTDVTAQDSGVSLIVTNTVYMRWRHDSSGTMEGAYWGVLL